MIAALLFTSILAASSPGRVVIRAGSIEITAAHVAQRAAQLRAAGRAQPPEQVVEGLASEVGLAAEAVRSGLAASPDGAAATSAERQKILAELYVAETAKRFPRPTEAELRATYHQGEDTARLNLVVLATLEEAVAARARLEKGGDFAAEARVSLDPDSAARRGDTGVVSRVILDKALAAAVFSAKKGALVGPIQQQHGWAVARVIDTTVGTEAGFAAARGRIEASAMSRVVAQARAHASEMLRKGAAVSINDSVLAALGAGQGPSEADAGRTVLTVDKRSFTLREVLPAIRAAPMVSHGGGKVSRAAVEGFAEEHLLALEAQKTGMDRTPENAALLRRAETYALARLMGQRILAELPAKWDAERRAKALMKRIDEYRKRHDVRVERSAALEAAGG